MFAILISITTCVAVCLLLQEGNRRLLGMACGLFNSMLWAFAGITSGAYLVTLVAAICAIQFAYFMCVNDIFSRRGLHAD